MTPTVASARINVTIRLHIPPMDEWQARLARAWLGPVAVNAWTQMGPKQLTQYAYPGQPSTRTTPPVRPCTCLYCAAPMNGHNHIETLKHTLIPTYGLPAISWFYIDPWCPHHGHAAHDPDLWRQANPPLITGI